ncbi:MAG: xanthine dehydrogenase family protein molybdopterin-binding subunit, partial [Alphaproteobacteria bacterium]|nr:xanthine dehydrogenase family protein molybdopterin-binding subunit [Alphaproteobacteria bacterium]
HQATNNVGSLAGVYATQHLHVRVRGVYTNTSSVSPYRGAGRPEALYAMERLIDRAAEQTGIDRMELRRRNLITPDDMPFRTGLVFTYDSGDFPKALEKVLAESDWAGFEKGRAESSRQGRLRGIGFAFAIEIAGGPLERPFDEHAEARVDAQGGLTLFMGTHSHGQGHETSFRQIASETFGIPAECIRILYGDTDQVAFGRGTFGSRSMSSGGAALTVSANRLLGKARAIAGHLLEAHGGDIQYVQRQFHLEGTDRSVSWEQVAAAAYQTGALPPGMELGLSATAIVSTSAPTFPNSAHVCEVEIDPETGTIGIVGYWVVDDAGRVINPMLLYGQIHGGVVQGLGQVLGENICYDREGQLLSGTFMDYFMPRADQMPAIVVHSLPVPTKANPLGVKGAGEAGVVGALPAAMNAIVDALKPCGVRHLDMPCTPEKIWNLLKSRIRTRP